MQEQDFFRSTSSQKGDLPHPRVAVEAIWTFLTTVKNVQKRDGRSESFSIDKIERSVDRILQEAGKGDDFLLRTACDRVMDTLQTRFDGVRVPTTEEIRQTVNTVCAEYGAALREKPVQPIPTNNVSQDTISHTIPTPMHDFPPQQSSQAGSLTDAATAPKRRRLGEERKSITHKFSVGGQEGYLTVGLYDDGQPGEIFINMNKEGSMMSGLMDSFATAISIGLQYGVPLKVFVKKFVNMHFEPNGETQNPNIPTARSMMDYIFRWLAVKFLTPEERQSVLGVHTDEDRGADTLPPTLGNVDGARQPRFLNGSGV